MAAKIPTLDGKLVRQKSPQSKGKESANSKEKHSQADTIVELVRSFLPERLRRFVFSTGVSSKDMFAFVCNDFDHIDLTALMTFAEFFGQDVPPECSGEEFTDVLYMCVYNLFQRSGCMRDM